MHTMQRIALLLVIIGAINWGLIGLFQFDLVASIFGGQDALLSRIVYGLVGLSGLYSLSLLFNNMMMEDDGVDLYDKQIHYGTEFGSEYDIDKNENSDEK